MLFTYCNLLVIFGIGLILAGTPLATAAEADHSPVGLWKTYDDRTHQARGTIRIYEANGTFAGKIESSFNPAELTERCHKCSGDRKGAPVIGLVIMRGMTRHGAEFDGGDNGSICSDRNHARSRHYGNQSHRREPSEGRTAGPVPLRLLR